MSAAKPIVFVSHASEDKDLVIALKGCLDQGCNHSIEFFVSSDGESIPGGLDWMRVLEERLKAARLALLFITRNFLDKRWCYFEAGGAIFRDVAVLPAWYSDVTAGDLPYVIHRLQGYQLADRNQVKSMLRRIVGECGMQHAPTDSDCAELQSRIGLGEPPSANTEIEQRFEEYCLGLTRSTQFADRISGIRMLSGLRTESALCAIVGQMADENRHVREVVFRTLQTLSAAHNVDLVKLLLADLPYQSHEAIRDTARLIQAIGKPGDIIRIDEFLSSCRDSVIRECLSAVQRTIEKRFL